MTVGWVLWTPTRPDGQPSSSSAVAAGSRVRRGSSAPPAAAGMDIGEPDGSALPTPLPTIFKGERPLRSFHFTSH